MGEGHTTRWLERLQEDEPIATDRRGIARLDDEMIDALRSCIDDEHGEARAAELPDAGAVPAVEPTTSEVRRWALENGHEVSDRGRLRPEIWDAYRNAHMS